MKRSFILMAMLFSVLFIVACSNKKAVHNEESEKEDASDALQTTIIGGRTGGAWSVFTEGVAESIRRENKGAVVTVEPGGIVENPPAVGTNLVPYGITYSMTAYAAYTGTEPYPKAYEDIRAISVIVPGNYYQFVVRSDAPYNSIDEIVENKIPIRLSVNQQGSAGEIITKNILHEYGITYENIVDWGGAIENLSDVKTYELMADKRIDANGNAVSIPSSGIIEASTTTDLKMLSFNKEVLQAVSNDLGMEIGTIKAGSYDFLQDDIDTLFTPAILIVHKDVPDEEVYQITKAIYNNFEFLGTVHEEFKNLTADNMMEVGQVPLHPGAEKFFKKAGMLD
ncbi:hypothetical protein BI350_09490 [Sporosarcina ureilytica]|uniref:TAXI family TRAP transporter solute-binding subunit n=2 Tax=Sporosarcina ureilytica TaxID=298596 RepID=A0A1D8JGB7_9BACL|nr:hypothetical protein BI350_09490 [Sporosarcina ureilytica]